MFLLILLCNAFSFFRSALTLIWYGNAAFMVNKISCDSSGSNSLVQQLTSDTIIEVGWQIGRYFNCGILFWTIVNILLMLHGNQVIIDIPFPFRAIPVNAIESTGTQVLEQILKIMLPRFMAQVGKTCFQLCSVACAFFFLSGFCHFLLKFVLISKCHHCLIMISWLSWSVIEYIMISCPI